MLQMLADPEMIAAVGSVGAIRERVALAATATRRDMRTAASDIEIVADRASFDRLEPDWLALEDAAAATAVFQGFRWCRAVWDHHVAHKQGFQPRILTIRDAGRLVGILPLQIVRTGVARTATGMGEPYQQYTEILLAPDAPRATAFRLVDAAMRLPGSDGLELLKVRDDSPLASLLAARGATRGNADGAPFVELRPFAAFADYYATVNAKTRKNMRNTRNRLGRVGRLDHVVHTEPAAIAALVARTHEGRERWLEAQGLTSRAFRDPSFGAFAQGVAAPDSGMEVLAMSLTLDGKPIADQWGLVHNGRYTAYFATWDPAFEEWSPGKLHLEEVFRTVHERGLGVADFLMPALRYKLTWTDSVMPAADYALASSLRAKLQFTIWSGAVRPALKRLAYRMPAGLRGAIARIVLRRG